MRVALGDAPARRPRRRTRRRASSRVAGQPLQLRVPHRGQHHPVVRGSATGSTGSSPSSIADGSSGVSRHDQRALPPEGCTAPASADQSASAITGSARPSRPGGARRRPGAPGAGAGRGPRRSPATTSTRSPARAASAVSSSAGVHRRVEARHVVDPARRGARRCRARGRPDGRARAARCGRRPSGCVRSPASRSLRTSSPRTYSRSESNSVPWPRTRTAARPSSSRSRASRLGRCLRDSNGGSTRTAPAPSRVAAGRRDRAGPGCARVTPSGPQVAAPRRAQRRWPAAARSPGCEPRAGAGSGRARRVGCQASRTQPRSRRRSGVADHEGAGRAPWPARTRSIGGARRNQRGREGARTTSSAARGATTTAPTATSCPAVGRSTHRRQSQEEQERDPPGEGHRAQRGTGHRAEGRGEHLRSTSTPSSSASGRSAEPVGQGRVGQRLDVVGRDEVAAREPGPGPRRAQQRGRAARADAQRRATAPARVARATSTT